MEIAGIPGRVCIEPGSLQAGVRLNSSHMQAPPRTIGVEHPMRLGKAAPELLAGECLVDRKRGSHRKLVRTEHIPVVSQRDSR